jgi:hypothetical protein
MTTVYALHPLLQPGHVGELPYFIDENDPRPAREQLDANYAHGGGWQPMPGFRLSLTRYVLRYPGDPPLEPLAVMRLRAEWIFIYQHSIVAIVQQDGSFEVARMD